MISLPRRDGTIVALRAFLGRWLFLLTLAALLVPAPTRAQEDAPPAEAPPAAEGEAPAEGEAAAEAPPEEPPGPRLDGEFLKARLPKAGAKLADGEPYVVLVVGDESALAVDWQAALVAPLAEASGNAQVSVKVAARAGRTAEEVTTVFETEMVPQAPNLVVIWLGAVEARIGMGVDAYLESLQWLRAQFGGRTNADTVLAEPWIGRPESGEVATFAHYTARYAERAGIPLARWLDLPPGETGPDPAALGEALVVALSPPPPVIWTTSGQLVWTSTGPRARLSLALGGDQPRRGTISVLTRDGETFDRSAPQTYEIEAGGGLNVALDWTGFHSPGDLLRPPFRRLLNGSRAMVTLIDTPDEGPRKVLGIEAVSQPEALWIRNEGEVSIDNHLRVAIESADRPQYRDVSWPEDSEVGRIGLIEPAFDNDGAYAWAAAELYYLRFAGGHGGESTADGDMGEWAQARWSSLSDPAQVRGGPVPPGLPQIEWAARIGRRGLAFAVRADDPAPPDLVQIALDTRSLAQLGGVGPYYWLDIRFEPDGKLAITPGPTSPGAEGLTGTWRADGSSLSAEITVPYGLVGLSAWPEDDFIGVGVLWHQKDLVFNWAGDHPWLSAREFSLLQRVGRRDTPGWLLRVR